MRYNTLNAVTTNFNGNYRVPYNACDMIKQNEPELGNDMLLVSDYFLYFEHYAN